MDNSAHSRAYPAIIGTAAVVVAVTVRWFVVAFDGAITGFFRIGDVLPLSPRLATQRVFVFEEQAGYDGQLFLTIALDPGLCDRGSVRALDCPAYRYRRILYPSLAFAVALGNRTIIPYALVLINVACAVLIVWVVSGMFLRAGLRRNSSVFVLALPGLWIVLSMATAELVSGLFLVLAVSADGRGHVKRCSFFLLLTCLARETMALTVIAFALAAASHRDWRRVFHLSWSVMPAAVWYMYICFGFRGSGPPPSHWFGLPGAGVTAKVLSLANSGLTARMGLESASFLLVISFFAVILASARKLWNKHRPVLLVAITYLLLLVFARLKLLGYYVDLFRIFFDVQLLVVLTLGVPPVPAKVAVLAAGGFFSVAYVLAYTFGLI